MKMNIWKLNNSIGDQPLNGDYIAGLVQADGSFSSRTIRKTRGNKSYIGLSNIFTLVQKQEYKELILKIKQQLGDIGSWYISPKDKCIRYQISKIDDLHNIVIPFFMKHHLRSGKLQSFLRFKYIVEVMYNKQHRNNKNILLSLIVIASNMNPLGKLGNKIRYLDKSDINLVLANKQPDGVDISKLESEIQNFKVKPINVEFIYGLIDGDGSISVYFKKQDTSNRIRVLLNFTIAQDTHNVSLLDEIKEFFGTGYVYNLNKNYSIFNTGSIQSLAFHIFPKLNINLDKIILNSPNFPIIKKNKFYYSGLILYILINKKENLSEDVLNKIFSYSYYISEQWYHKDMDSYIRDLKEKLKI